MRVELIAQLLASGMPVDVRAFGDSMNPIVRSGDTLRVEPIRPCEISPGHVLLCRFGDKVIAHRVWRLGIGQFFLRGDRAGYDDGWISFKAALGRVVSVVREAGRLISVDCPWLLLGVRRVGYGCARFARLSLRRYEAARRRRGR